MACISKHFRTRTESFMREELSLAAERFGAARQERLIPVLLSGEISHEPVSGGLDLCSLQAIDLRQDWEDGVARLATTLHGASVRDQAKIASLRPRLRCNKASARAAAAMELMKYAQHPAAFPLLEEGLGDSAVEVLNILVGGLRMTGPRGLPMLVRAMKRARNQTLYLVLAMHASLWEGESSELVAQLVTDLGRDDSIVRNSAAEALAKVAGASEEVTASLRHAISEGKLEVEPLLAALKGDRSVAARTLAREIREAQKAVASLCGQKAPTEHQIQRVCGIGPLVLGPLAAHVSSLHGLHPAALARVLVHFARAAVPALAEHLRQYPEDHEELLPFLQRLASPEDVPRLERVNDTLQSHGSDVTETRRAVRRVIQELATRVVPAPNP